MGVRFARSATKHRVSKESMIAVEGDRDDLIVIDAMALRDKYLAQYEEARQWRL